ncbi:basic helix-loop-helix ARNT-like protein 1 [Plodia interpunctella]|uniref:Juvenile hormone receptor methoprene-tolerant n=1 Tax=Plodia interpunctella TaxID=58824 RepID=A0A1B2INL9_PLOIN|nr:basic helix-loop-helix ARNT-like protein 1 [Plodia interpunctella]ANZ54967.1 juvenile hormone receptor methoprene-tolerant [Plodia interpunctella]
MASPSGIGRAGVHATMAGQLSSTNQANFGMSVAVQPSSALVYDLHAAGCSDSSSESHSPEMPSAKASDRESRIIAEKQRRSQYNAQISQITGLLTDIVHSQRKVDKTSVLRLAANKLRNEHVFGDSITCGHIETWSSAFVKYFDLFDGIMLAVTCRGRIFLVSPNVQEKLGYCHIDLLGQDLYNYVHHEDKNILKEHIYPPELRSGCDRKLLEEHHNFHIRIMRAGAKSDPPRYEQCRLDGVLRRSDRATTNAIQDEQTIRRQRVRHNRTFSSSGNDMVFIGMIHIQSNALPARILPPTAYTEYWTRHLIDGRIVQCDQSISLAAGYMTEEVTGTSAFVFMHKDDVRWVICVLRQMYDQSREFGESYYRLMSRSGHFIYMRTRGFLEIDKDTKKVQSFVCVNSVIGEDYGRRMMEEMKRKYSVIVDMANQQTEIPAIDEAPVEHPKRLERIVMHLVEPSSKNAEELKLVAPSKETIITAIKNSERVVQETGIRFDSRKRKKDDDLNCEHLKRHSGMQEFEY